MQAAFARPNPVRCQPVRLLRGLLFVLLLLGQSALLAHRAEHILGTVQGEIEASCAACAPSLDPPSAPLLPLPSGVWWATAHASTLREGLVPRPDDWPGFRAHAPPVRAAAHLSRIPHPV